MSSRHLKDMLWSTVAEAAGELHYLDSCSLAVDKATLITVL